MQNNFFSILIKYANYFASSMLEEKTYYHNMQKPKSLNFAFTIAKILNYKTFINKKYKIRL